MRQPRLVLGVGAAELHSRQFEQGPQQRVTLLLHAGVMTAALITALTRHRAFKSSCKASRQHHRLSAGPQAPLLAATPLQGC